MLLEKATVGSKIYRIGDKFNFVKGVDVAGYGGLMELKKGEVLTIVVIKTDRSNETLLFGITPENGRAVKGWHDLDGRLNKENGYYVEVAHLTKCFNRGPIDMVVNKNFPFRKKNLKDMRCKVISPMPGSAESLVEFTENVGGCGADGLGKGGHCLIVPNDALSPVKEKVKTKSKRNKKKKK